MDLESSYEAGNEQQFWDELGQVVSRSCDSHDLIDDALRLFFNIATKSRGKHINIEHDVARCSYILLSSSVFDEHEDYIRRQIVHSLLQDDDSDTLLFVTSLLLLDIRELETTAELLNEEGAFTRLVDLISKPKQNGEATLHRMLMELLYEMSRIQQIRPDDLVQVEDAFVCQLFELIEELSNDVNDPYHYPIIRVLLVLNEQFMVSAHDPSAVDKLRLPLTNKVIKVLASQGSHFKTFGENIILLLNRESETSLQLLTLKLLYLLFTTPATQEYFYTNDLRVLVDILIRNLLDLPSDAAALRHTYLRVLYPLLAHTQLKQPPHYKYEEIRKLLSVLAGGQSIQENSDDSASSGLWGHFDEADETTKRLVTRCKTVGWLKDLKKAELEVQADVDKRASISPVDVVLGEKVPPAPPVPRKLRKCNGSKMAPGFLAPQLDSARQSALSVLEVAAQREKPGIITPSRKASLLGAVNKKEKPLPPKARRSAWSRRAKDAGPSASDQSTDASAPNVRITEPGQPEKLLETRVVVPVASGCQQLPSPMKRPPPAPKARGWRGKCRKRDEGGGGGGDDDDENRVDMADKSPSLTIPGKMISGSEAGSPQASVAEALSSVQAAAMDSIGEAFERVNLGPSTTPEVKTVLAPPSPAPPRGVPGPTFSLEESPFIGEDEED